jgi:hypothetical protein
LYQLKARLTTETEGFGGGSTPMDARCSWLQPRRNLRNFNYFRPCSGRILSGQNLNPEAVSLINLYFEMQEKTISPTDLH